MEKKDNLSKELEQDLNEENLAKDLENDNETSKVRNADNEAETDTETSAENTCESEQSSETSSCDELEKIKAELEEKTKKCEEYFERLQRTAAEFDNYKKRTAREKEALYLDATSDIVAAFLPVIDNIERALEAANNTANADSLKEGIELVYRQIQDVLKKLDVEVIQAVGNEFDPNLHNAVSHIDDENYGSNVVVEEFQKGYIYKDKVIRYSMVKVAN
ncbi:nucleotide exchange factor GrpE [Acetivibrio clariflavus]|uniref:Protein GrpE n=1 Tax=Acetivibrio clariflavus (strain DSM 19732 / NBRC 101661 / EBR45) TaxID=720554 RepID=G8M313_ACECE|nr:nucleotide exchange factor GrpE [Acetivibrio clariflavus]AEV69322.1 molecular chaperone GrpE (heat shock protein) [Acetivibrio clariflavus DSM 19732]